jgi:hypothetical protein
MALVFDCANCKYLDGGADGGAASTHPFQFCMRQGGPASVQFGGQRVPPDVRKIMFAYMTQASNAYLRNPSMGVRIFEQELSNAIACRGTQRQGGANGRYQAANVQPLVFDAQASAGSRRWDPRSKLRFFISRRGLRL